MNRDEQHRLADRLDELRQALDEAIKEREQMLDEADRNIERIGDEICGVLQKFPEMRNVTPKHGGEHARKTNPTSPRPKDRNSDPV